jgi:hypothetical protein
LEGVNHGRTSRTNKSSSGASPIEAFKREGDELFINREEKMNG